jgi:hypothetical protein
LDTRVRFYRIILEDFNANESATTVGWWGNGILVGFDWPPDYGSDPMPDRAGPA